MNNYEYIVASLPALQQDDARSEKLDVQGLVDEIRSQISAHDAEVLSVLLGGFNSDKLNPDFYRAALKHSNRFIRDWFRFDLDLRNITVSYINDSLGRPENQDMILLEGRETEEFFELDDARNVLNIGDILKRERGLDELRWRKIDELTVLDTFNLEALLGYVAKLKIIDRWLQLDPDSGRELFRRLVEDVRSTYDNKKQNLTI